MSHRLVYRVFLNQRYVFLGSPLLCAVANVVEHERHKLGVKWPLERQSDHLSLQLKSFYLTNLCWWDWAVWLVLSPLNQQWAPNCIWFHLQLIQHSGGWSRTRVQRVCKIQLGLNPSVCLLSIEGEYVPVEGDEVSYKVCCIPPKLEKIQAVEVTITHLKPGTKHETWSGRTVDSWTPEPRWWEGRGVGGVSMIGGAGWKNEVRGE